MFKKNSVGFFTMFSNILNLNIKNLRDCFKKETGIAIISLEFDRYINIELVKRWILNNFENSLNSIVKFYIVNKLWMID